ncbi:hypothetical protein K7X08_022990 [Anisodus acutangulus]|uniref:WRKY domain-containing protein n=1 Tax=Anisodus acutangulus TaxID=402998 RepID=A0A9Q1MBT4_9SOLA|nr:hypothetical protein K7X08_022990 [Anisodus acutangulus]
MEKVKDWDKKTLITELTQGKEFVNKLKNQFDPLASPEKCDLLLEKILSSLDKSLSILNWKVFNGTKDPFSCCSTISDLGSLRDQGQNKKRKILHWRKYGQKDILGTNHPRAYYRCTHRNTQSCLATKLVQKSDEDPLVFEVTYKGRHSCKASQSSIFISYEDQKANCNKNQCQLKKQKVGNQKVEKLNIKEKAFPFTPLKCESQNAQFFANSIEPFTSPIESESMYLSLLPTQEEEEFEMGKILQSSESDRIEFIWTPTSVINSPFCADWDLSVDDPSLMVDISEYFT